MGSRLSPTQRQPGSADHAFHMEYKQLLAEEKGPGARRLFPFQPRHHVNIDEFREMRA